MEVNIIIIWLFCRYIHNSFFFTYYYCYNIIIIIYRTTHCFFLHWQLMIISLHIYIMHTSRKCFWLRWARLCVLFTVWLCKPLLSPPPTYLSTNRPTNLYIYHFWGKVLGGDCGGCVDGELIIRTAETSPHKGPKHNNAL